MKTDLKRVVLVFDSGEEFDISFEPNTTWRGERGQMMSMSDLLGDLREAKAQDYYVSLDLDVKINRNRSAS